MRKTSLRPCAFEHVVMPDKIGPRISRRVLQRIAYASLRRKMNDCVEAFRAGDPAQTSEVCDVALGETETLDGFKQSQARALQPGIVIGIDGIDAQDLVSLLQERFSGVEANEASSASEKYSHSCVGPCPSKWT